jgi:D-psicose/D-tagatose/L-ribulose 3-epimerase
LPPTPELARGLSVWRPVARGEAEATGEALPFLSNEARQPGLI